MIEPEVGRHVHYFKDREAHGAGTHYPRPRAAIITACSWSFPDPGRKEFGVDLAILNQDSIVFVRNVALVQPDDPLPYGMPFCMWMPWQVKQAEAERVTEDIGRWGKGER